MSVENTANTFKKLKDMGFKPVYIVTYKYKHASPLKLYYLFNEKGFIPALIGKGNVTSTLSVHVGNNNSVLFLVDLTDEETSFIQNILKDFSSDIKEGLNYEDSLILDSYYEDFRLSKAMKYEFKVTAIDILKGNKIKSKYLKFNNGLNR